MLPGPYLYGGVCPRCGKPEHGYIACEFANGWREPPKVTVEATRVDPYFVYERIASALERIAAAMEASNQDSSREGSK